MRVVFEILTHLATLSDDCSKCIEVIKTPTYQGLPVIEYDIKSGYEQGIIIQVSSVLTTIFKLRSIIIFYVPYMVKHLRA